jgi:Patatin-like phospholipase
MTWALLGRLLRLTFLLRVPLLTLGMLAALGPLAFRSSLLGNLLDQGNNNPGLSAWYLFSVSFSAFILAFTAVTNINITLHYGADRLDEGRALGLSQKRPLLTFALGCAAALTLVVCVYKRTTPPDPWNAVFLVLGFIAAFALVILAKVVQLALTDPTTTRHPPPFLVFPAYMIPFAERIFDNIYCWSSPGSRSTKSWFNAISQWPLGILQGAGQGYLSDLDPPMGQPLRLRSGHVFAFSLFVIAFLCYLSIGWNKAGIQAADNKVPALAFVLLFLIVACWALSALSFFFDRYRFPLLWTIGALSLLTISTPQSDHFFRVVTREAAMQEPLSAVDYMKKRLGASKTKRLIVVATPGGGIQAAAWTAEVLTQLDQSAPGFRDSVAVISSVSGGSLGAIIYAASFAGNIDKKDVAENSRRSAIDEVAWGWTVPDLWRAILPWFRSDRAIDRGWALEKKWAAINNLHDDDRTPEGTTLGNWSAAARNGAMPALIINSMLVERGGPVVFSNTRFPAARDPNGRIANFYDLYPVDKYLHYDIRVNTAARLSASFSYVAPASRPDLDGPYNAGFHFVDGGYYDNFGITSLLAWLTEALDNPGLASQLDDILILQIRHFLPPTPPVPSRQGWGFQIGAPAFALYNMRDYAQDSVARNQLELFGKYYKEKASTYGKPALNIRERALVPMRLSPGSWMPSNKSASIQHGAACSSLRCNASSRTSAIKARWPIVI